MSSTAVTAVAALSATASPGSGLLVRPYEPGIDDAGWDRLVDGSCNGTFLHTRRFLSYHGDRFADLSLMVEDARGRLRAVFPAAWDPSGRRMAVSHPGITYGGVVHDGSLRGAEMIEALALILRHLGDRGATGLVYKAVPFIYHQVPSHDDTYALFRLGATRTRCDLSASVDLSGTRRVTKGRKHMRGVARRSGVSVDTGWEQSSAFWCLLEDNLARRHGTKPVHTHEEMLLLAERFPDRIALHGAYIDGDLVAGGVVFCTGPTVHLQYVATGDRGRETGALDAVVESVIETGIKHSFRYFDYGISTEQGGQVLNSSLYSYKLSFGAGGVVYEHYEVTLP